MWRYWSVFRLTLEDNIHHHPPPIPFLSQKWLLCHYVRPRILFTNSLCKNMWIKKAMERGMVTFQCWGTFACTQLIFTVHVFTKWTHRFSQKQLCSSLVQHDILSAMKTMEETIKKPPQVLQTPQTLSRARSPGLAAALAATTASARTAVCLISCPAGPWVKPPTATADDLVNQWWVGGWGAFPLSPNRSTWKVEDFERRSIVLVLDGLSSEIFKRYESGDTCNMMSKQ